MAGSSAERQEKGFVDAVNKAIADNDNNPISLLMEGEKMTGVVAAHKYSGRQMSGSEPYTDIVIEFHESTKRKPINISCKGESAPSLAGGGLRGLEEAVPGLGPKFLKQVFYELLNRRKLNIGDPVPNVFGLINQINTVKIVVGTTSMGGPIDYMYIGPMTVTSRYDKEQNLLTLNGKFFESYAYAKKHRLYMRYRARREDQRFDPQAKDSRGSPRIYGKSPSKGDVGGRIVLVDENDVPNAAIIVKI
jgi:hypothetical protein